LLKWAGNEKASIFLLGDTAEVLDSTIRNFKKQFKNIRIAGYMNGFNFKDEEIIDLINKSKTDILLVGMGVPKQEKWVMDNYIKLNANLIITVGAFFSFYSESTTRAPKILRSLSLEWLYRLFQEPVRLYKRYFFDFPAFFVSAIFKRLLK
jgi:N-acetylglucosaminyldiphosphoundecaprenol N-acetyl-beta-D-mannosaminyltransferase